jgi:alanine racemase
VSYGASYRAVGDRRIATIGIGYADGFRRAWGDHGAVLVRGKRAPVAGVVNMDMTMVDVTGIPCEPGDVATLLGHAAGEHLDLNVVARECGMSPYEILTGLRLRAPRIYQA